MKIKFNAEMIAGGLFTVVSGLLWFLIPSQVKTMETTAINAQTFPRIAIGGLFIFSFILLIQGLFFIPKREIELNKEYRNTREYRDVVRSSVYILIIIGFVFLFKFFGFIPSTICMVFAVLRYYGARTWFYYAIPLSVVGIVYFIFSTMLHISLP
jgi:uncharacterized protein YjeT (DUF2065 family)